MIKNEVDEQIFEEKQPIITIKEQENGQVKKFEDDDIPLLPDEIQSVQVQNYEYKEKILVLSLQIEKPQDYGNPIESYLFYIKNTLIFQVKVDEQEIKIEIEKTKCEIINKNVYKIELEITAKNKVGESKRKQFKIFNNIVEKQKGTILYSGPQQTILIDEQIIEEKEIDFLQKSTSDFVKIKLGSNEIQEIGGNKSIVISDGLHVIEWGEIIEMKENKICQLVTSPYQIINRNYVKQLECGDYCGFILDVLGDVYSWGANTNFELGHNDCILRQQAEKINVSYFNHQKIIRISCTYKSVLALTETLKVYTWGYRQAINGIRVDDRFGDQIDLINKHFDQSIPRLVSYFNDKQANIIQSGHSHCLVLSSSGLLYGWGLNYFGQLGSQQEGIVPKLLHITAHLKLINIAVGFFHNLVLDHQGSLYSFGYNKFGQCANDPHQNTDFIQTQLAQVYNSQNIVDIKCGETHSLIVIQQNERKKLIGFGKISDGQLGLVETNNKYQWQPFELKIAQKHCIINQQLGYKSTILISKKEQQ